MKGCILFRSAYEMAPLEIEKGMIMLLKECLIVCMHKGLKVHYATCMCIHVYTLYTQNNLHNMNSKMCPVSPSNCVVCIRSILLSLRTQNICKSVNATNVWQ